MHVNFRSFLMNTSFRYYRMRVFNFQTTNRFWQNMPTGYNITTKVTVMKAIRLRTEYLQEPIGIDIVRPRFFWNCEGGIKQTAYRLFAMRRRNRLGPESLSDAMTHIAYDGNLFAVVILSTGFKLWMRKERR